MSEETVVVPAFEADELDKKVVGAFPGKTVRKDLTALMKRGANVPTFVLEYLLGMYCSTDDSAMVEEGLGVSMLYRRTVEGVRADIKVLPIAAAPSRDVVAAWRSWETMPIATRKFIDYMSSHIEA